MLNFIFRCEKRTDSRSRFFGDTVFSLPSGAPQRGNSRSIEKSTNLGTILGRRYAGRFRLWPGGEFEYFSDRFISNEKERRGSNRSLGRYVEVHSAAVNLHTRTHSMHGSRPEAGMAACIRTVYV